MADISGLNLKAPERIEGPYQDKGEYTPPPNEGVYTLQAPDKFEFKGDKNGNMGATIQVRIVEGQQGAGYTLYSYISTMKSKFRAGNTACDYLRAHGIEVVPETNQQYADLIESTAGRVFQASTIWEAYDSEADETVLKGQDQFPVVKDEATGAVIPDELTGQAKRSYRAVSKVSKKEVLASLKIKRFVSAVAAQA